VTVPDRFDEPDPGACPDWVSPPDPEFVVLFEPDEPVVPESDPVLVVVPAVVVCESACVMPKTAASPAVTASEPAEAQMVTRRTRDTRRSRRPLLPDLSIPSPSALSRYSRCSAVNVRSG
jgi:hypothetical protein